VGAGLAPVLRRHGFARKARRFVKTLPACAWVVEVEAGRFNTGSTGSFSVELGVFHPAWFEQAWALPRMQRIMEPAADPPRIWNCLARESLSILACGDLHWNVEAETPVDRLASGVADAMTTTGLPWLERMTPLAASVAALSDQFAGLQGAWLYKMMAMFGHVALGDIGDAARMYRAADGDVITSEEMEREFGDWARERGVLPPRPLD